MTEQRVPGATRRPSRRRERAELLLVLSLPLAVHAAAAHYELYERMAPWLQRLERWQVDELPITLTVLALGLAVYAWRRRGEARAALRRQRQEEARATELLLRNRELAQGLIALQEHERRALARELHDEIGQCCTALRIETAQLKLADSAPLRAAAARADDTAREIHQLVRRLLHRLRPQALDTLGLQPALQELCEGWELRSGVACVFLPEDAPEAFDDEVAITVYRVAQEALTNVVRHAQASTVRVRLGRCGRRELRLVVEDDGVGVALAEAANGLALRRGFGLLGATERAAALGGRLELGSAPEGGTRLVLTLPVRAAVAEEGAAA